MLLIISIIIFLGHGLSGLFAMCEFGSLSTENLYYRDTGALKKQNRKAW
jgi:hypothetical protein